MATRPLEFKATGGHGGPPLQNRFYGIYFSASLRPAFKLSQFMIALNTRK